MPKRVLPEEFKQRCLKVFKNYDYSKTLFTSNANQVIKYFCPKHGEQNQRLDNHLKYGCPSCAEEERFQKNKKDFFRKAKLKQGNKYDYSKVNYINTNTKVEIICPIHGSFWQIPNNHLQGQGCPKCGKESRAKERLKNINQFIEEAKKVHNDKYDYSKIYYKNARIKVEIICPIHGSFFQTPDSHLNGQGCPVCGRERPTLRLTKLEILQKIKEAQGDKYSYAKSNFDNIKSVEDKIEIICPIHGSFFQKIHSHIYGGEGCPKCKESHGEKKIRKWLEEKNIEYVYQKKFKDLGRLSYDFYIPSKNLLIEFQGEQHYKPVESFGGLESFKKQRENDYKKKELC